MCLLRKPPNPIPVVYNSLKINGRFGDFLAEKIYRRGFMIETNKSEGRMGDPYKEILR